VRAHTRRKRRGLLSPRHSWSLIGRAFRAARARRRVTAAVLGGLAVAELAAWLTLTGAALVIATAGVLAFLTGFLLSLVTGTGPADAGRWSR
jgi:hypothetical protein